MKKLFLILAIVIANSIVSFSQPILTCTKDSGTNGILMVWTGDAPPYDAIRGIAPDPFAGEYQTIADDINGNSYIDNGALLASENYYYLVASSDNCTCSMLSSIIKGEYKVDRGRVNDVLIITGACLASSDTKIFLNKKEIPPISINDKQVTFIVPAGSLSGDFLISTMKGATNPKSFKVESAWELIQISHINYSSDFLWIDDVLGATANTIFKVDSNGVKTKIGSINRPNGLPIANISGTDYTWYGISLENPANRGTISWTSINGGESMWGSIKPTGQTAYCAAIAVNKNDTSFVYAADKYNGEIRVVYQNQYGGGLFTSGLLMNNPSGMAVDNINAPPNANSLWISLQSKVRQYSSAGALLKEYTDTNKISTYPAGMNFDDEGKLWLAKKSANRIERIDTVNDKFRELNISVTSPTGVATMMIGGAGGDLIGFASEGTSAITFPHNNLVRLHIKIVNNAYSIYFTDMLRRANDALSQCGIEFQLSGFEYIDMGPNFDRVDISFCSNPPNCTLTNEEIQVLSQNRSSSPNDINVYLVHKRETLLGVLGQTITADHYAINDQTGSGIILSQELIDYGPGLAVVSTLAHEITHFLIDRSTWPAPSEHHDPATDQIWNILNLMHDESKCSNFRLTQPPTASSQCGNINDLSNPYNSYIDPL